MPGKKPNRKSGPKVKKSNRKVQPKSIRKTTGKRVERLNSLKDSQKYLNIALDTASMGVWEWTIKTDKVKWGGNFLTPFGISSSTFDNSVKAFLEFVHPEDRSIIPVAIKQAVEQNKPYNIEYRIIRKDGSMRWVNARANVTRNKAGKAIRLSGTLQDITDRKTLEQEREEWKSRFELTTSAAGLVIYDCHIPSGEIKWNDTCLEVLGYRSDELSSLEKWLDLIHPDDRGKSFRLLEEAREKSHIYDVFYRFKRKNGTYSHIHDRGIFQTDPKGTPDRIIGIMNDVTEIFKAQEKLKESELRFRTLQEASFGGIGLHNKGKIIDCNQGLSDITGYSYEELVGSDGLRLIAPEWRDYVYDKIVAGYEKTYDVEGVKKDGTRYFLEIRGKNIPYHNQSIRVTEFRDITERKRTEQTIKEQHTRLLAVTEDLKRKNNQLEDFTQIVSHNLRSPVGNIIVLLNFLEGATTDTERNEYVGLLKEAATNTHTMLSELNDVLKIKQNQSIDKQHIYFEHTFKQVKSMLNAKITSLSAKITSDFSAAPDIHYPSIYLESILLNLLDNALKYHMPERTPEIHVSTSVTSSGEIILEIRDNGMGINLERYGHHIFKLRKTFHLHPESRGIGLFMVKNQIEAMGGEITVSSKENEGTSFFINFNKYQTDGS